MSIVSNWEETIDAILLLPMAEISHKSSSFINGPLKPWISTKVAFGCIVCQKLFLTVIATAISVKRVKIDHWNVHLILISIWSRIQSLGQLMMRDTETPKNPLNVTRRTTSSTFVHQEENKSPCRNAETPSEYKMYLLFLRNISKAFVLQTQKRCWQT